ncbi:MAG: dTDP-4-dehydrorhamnose 3,5-epimerase [Gammaproteobacteria bacterium]|nr:dTDP-4-dehydrorhamnose 3,5-epimerase [Gammaproteobacteria bacterium]
MKSDSFADIKIIKNKSFEDDRGYFSEIFNKDYFASNGINNNFIQDNISFSKKRGTIRGLHFQKNDYAQSKLLKVISGEIQDIFIDLRKNSPTYESYGHEILNSNSGWIYIPKGFAHGFCTLTDNVEVLYKVDNYYSKIHDAGILWNDSFFEINWSLSNSEPIISNKDRNLPCWLDIRESIEF